MAAALEGYETAAVLGLCHEGAWEAALSAIRSLDLDALADCTAAKAAPPADPGVMRVRQVMAAHVATLRPDDPLGIADDVMRLGRIRHLPVIDEAGGLLGLLTQRDLLRSALRALEERDEEARRARTSALRVAAVMTRDVVVTSPDAPLRDAASEMLRRKLGCLPVLEHGKVIGIVTEADFVRLAL